MARRKRGQGHPDEETTAMWDADSEWSHTPSERSGRPDFHDASVPTTAQDPSRTRPSRREKRKEAEDAMVICRALVDLSEQKLAKIPLPDDIAAEVATARKIRSNAAKKRQMLFLAKIMRQCEEQEEIAVALQRLSDLDRKGTAEFQRLESWRERLLEENDDALELFCQKYPTADPESLQTVIANVHKRTGTHRTAASRVLFRELRRIITASTAAGDQTAE